MCLHIPNAPDLYLSDDRLDLVAPPTLRDRSDLVQWFYTPRHHSRYHRFFSNSAWKLDTMSWVLARLVIHVLAPSGIIELAVDDTLCRKRGLTICGTGMHYDPLISSRAKSLTSWGHDWVVVTLIIRNLPWAPTLAWSLPLTFCLYRNHQGVTKGKKKTQPAEKKKTQCASASHRTRPEIAVELVCLVADWFPQRHFMLTGDSAYGGQSVLKKLPSNVDLISHVHPEGAMFKPCLSGCLPNHHVPGWTHFSEYNSA